MENDGKAVDISGILSDMPRVSEAAIAAELAQNQEISAGTEIVNPIDAQEIHGSTCGPVDYKGRIFDPALHEVDESGKPVVWGEKARLKMIRRGGAPGRKHARRELPEKHTAIVASSIGYPDSHEAQSPSVAEPDRNPEKAASTARVTVALAAGAARTVLGDEWVLADAEKTELTNALTEYYLIRGIVDIPPEAAVLAAISPIVASRINLPETQRRIGGIRARMMSFFRKASDKIAFPRNDTRGREDGSPCG